MEVQHENSRHTYDDIDPVAAKKPFGMYFKRYSEMKAELNSNSHPEFFEDVIYNHFQKPETRGLLLHSSLASGDVDLENNKSLLERLFESDDLDAIQKQARDIDPLPEDDELFFNSLIHRDDQNFWESQAGTTHRHEIYRYVWLQNALGPWWKLRSLANTRIKNNLAKEKQKLRGLAHAHIKNAVAKEKRILHEVAQTYIKGTLIKEKVKVRSKAARRVERKADRKAKVQSKWPQTLLTANEPPSFGPSLRNADRFSMTLNKQEKIITIMRNVLLAYALRQQKCQARSIITNTTILLAYGCML